MRGPWMLLSALAVLLVLAPARAPAAKEDPHAAPTAAAKHDEPGKEGGHKDAGADSPLKLVLDLTIWTSIVFLLMLLILWRFAWKPLLAGLQARENAISDAIAQAKRDRDEAAAMRQKLQQELDNAAMMVKGMLDEGRRDVQHQREEMLADARAEIQTEKERLRREIDRARDQALQDIWNRSAELAASISSKAIRRNLSVDDHRRLVDEALTELGEAVEDWRRRGGGPSV
jgi:F-type H+-transporting ATPase subunit b